MSLQPEDIKCRSSQRKCSIKKAVLKYFAIFTGKHLCWSLFLIKLQTLNICFQKISANGCLVYNMSLKELEQGATEMFISEFEKK